MYYQYTVIILLRSVEQQNRNYSYVRFPECIQMRRLSEEKVTQHEICIAYHM